MWFRELDFSGQSISLALAEVKDMPALEIARPGFQMHFAQGCRHVMQRVYEKVLAMDFARFINAGRYERTDRRRSQRNGYRQRSLLTAVGDLDLQVPRDRAGQFRPTVFARHERVHCGLAEVIRAMFLHGISTRKVGDELAALCGESVSASTVSTLTRVLDRAVQEFANAPIVDDFLFLILGRGVGAHPLWPAREAGHGVGGLWDSREWESGLDRLSAGQLGVGGVLDGVSGESPGAWSARAAAEADHDGRRRRIVGCCRGGLSLGAA